MKSLTRRIRDEVLPLLDGDTIALVELVVTLMSGDKTYPELSDVPAKKKSGALKKLKVLNDWEEEDPSILGRLYESHMEPGEGKSKQSPRRQSGAFYTPPYIAEFLVRSAVDGLKVGWGTEIPSVLDPACGGGAFLLAAFDELRERYPDEDPREIAVEHLYGIDSDEKGVHVARLSVWLKAGLTKRDWNSLEENIRAGDSLREFAKGSEKKWEIVVANPPYRHVKRGISQNLQEFCRTNYRSATGQWDLAAPFVEMTLDSLLVPGGTCGFIVPSPLLLAENYQPVREIVLENDLLSYGPAGQPFADPKVEASLIVVRAGKPTRRRATILDGRSGASVNNMRTVPKSLLNRLPFRVFSHLAEPGLLEPILDSVDTGYLSLLGDIVTIKRGLETGKGDERIRKGAGKDSTASRPLITGSNLRQFNAVAAHRWIGGKGKQTGIYKNRELWEGERQILLRRVADKPIAAVATPAALVLNTIYVLRGEDMDEYATCALLNSAMFREVFRELYAFDDRLFPYLRTSQLMRTPVPRAAFNDSKLSEWSKALHETISGRKRSISTASARTLVDRIDRRVRRMYGFR